MIKKTIVFLALVFFSCCTFGQDSLLILQSCKHPKRIKLIQTGEYITLGFDQKDGLTLRNLRSYYGTIKNLNKDTISMKVMTEHFNDTIPNGFRRNTTIEYYSTKRTENNRETEYIKKVNLKDVNFISKYRFHVDSDYGLQGSFLISAFFLLVVSPLASINFKTGEFNQNRYYRWLAWTGTAFTLYLPLFIISSTPKYYNFKDFSPDSHSKKLYKIRTK